MSTLKLDTLSNKAGTASVPSDTIVSGTAKAWINFDGRTNVINKAFNVSSLTDNGTGNYTVNFATPMPDANYCTVAASQLIATSADAYPWNIGAQTTTSAQGYHYEGAAFNDSGVMGIAFFY